MQCIHCCFQHLIILAGLHTLSSPLPSRLLPSSHLCLSHTSFFPYPFLPSLLPSPTVDVSQKHNCSTNKYKTKYEEPGRQILILYGTEYGFSEEVARKVFDDFTENKECAQLALQPRVVNARDYKLIEFDKEQVVLFVFSTTGDGGYHQLTTDYCCLPAYT